MMIRQAAGQAASHNGDFIQIATLSVVVGHLARLIRWMFTWAMPICDDNNGINRVLTPFVSKALKLMVLNNLK